MDNITELRTVGILIGENKDSLDYQLDQTHAELLLTPSPWLFENYEFLKINNYKKITYESLIDFW